MHQFITINFIPLPLRLLYDKDDKAVEMLTWMRKPSYLIAPTSSKKSEFITVETDPTFLGIKHLHGLKAVWQVSHLSRVTENRFFSFFLSHFTGKKTLILTAISHSLSHFQAN